MTGLIIVGIIFLVLGLGLGIEGEGASAFFSILLGVALFIMAYLVDNGGYAVTCEPSVVEVAGVDRANPEETYLMARDTVSKKLRLYRVPASNVHFTEKFNFSKGDALVRLVDGLDGCHAYPIVNE